MAGLSALYFAAGSVPWVAPLLLGLDALVVGLIFHIASDLAARNVQGRAQAAIALVAFVALLFKVNAVLITVVALGLGTLFIHPEPRHRSTSVHKFAPRHWIAIGAVVAVVVGGAAFAWSLHSDVGTMGLVFFKIGAVAFGNGTTIIPLIQADVVDSYHWLTLNQFADGIALGQVTPGPFLITAAFVGYKVGGLAGASLATFAMFSPSIAMTLVFTELSAHFQDTQRIRGALGGVMAAFVGLLSVVILELGVLR